MKKSYVLFASALLFALVGCISAERLADYEAWKVSDDAVANVEFDAFEAQYKAGWRERAAEKKAARLAREKAERKERERLEAERRAKKEADRKERERIKAERRAKEEAERKERERLEAERKARELQEAIDKTYVGFINEYWDNDATVSYSRALKGEYKDLANFIYIAEPDGVALIEAFAEEKMPNANAAYEKAKERAMELQQVYNEGFPVPVDNSSDKYSVYCKLLDRLAKARTAYHRAYKELAHYYFQYKFGIITQDELAKIDEKPILIDIIKLDSILYWPEHKTLEEKELAFAAKYMPESHAAYQLFLKEYSELSRVYAEAQAERQKANAFLDKVFEAAHHKGWDLVENINKLTSEYIDLYMQHRMGDKDSEALAKIDHERAADLKDFTAQLPMLVKNETFLAESLTHERTKQIVIMTMNISKEMVSIPERKFKMGKTEVTQAQWKAIMGNDPSYFKGDDRPVENVSWNDAQEFIKRLNDKSREIGMKVRYRLPTEEEWEYCCRAGSKGYWGKRANGQEGPLDVMGWYDRNSGSQTHPVAQKEPNAWGLYDMHGNVWEWTSADYASYRTYRGGSWGSSDNYCKAGNRIWNRPDDRRDHLGFRLVAEDL